MSVLAAFAGKKQIVHATASLPESKLGGRKDPDSIIPHSIQTKRRLDKRPCWYSWPNTGRGIRGHPEATRELKQIADKAAGQRSRYPTHRYEPCVASLCRNCGMSSLYSPYLALLGSIRIKVLPHGANLFNAWVRYGRHVPG